MEKELRILILEDNPVDAELAERELRQAGLTFTMKRVETREEFVRELDDCAPDLILADYHLPAFDGVSALALALDVRPSVPFIFVTGAMGEELAIETLKSGATDYVLKDRLTRLAPAVRRALREAEERAERQWAEDAFRESHRHLSEAHAELLRTQQQLVQAERLKALGEMAASIVHQFNNALTPILGFSELLLLSPQTLEDKARTRNHLRTIIAAAQDATNIVSRLREFYLQRDEAELMLPVNLNPLVEQAVASTQPRWKDRALANGRAIRMETDLPPVPPIRGNATKLRQMLTNLIFNAVDAMPDGGVITIRTIAEGMRDEGLGMRDEKGSSLISHLSSLILEVSDTGAGMDEETRQRCLEPFFSTKGEQGTGLGLATVYGIVQRHGGTMKIESQVGRGTTFLIRLPALMEQEERSAEAPQNGTEAPPRPLRVLVVDDQPLVCQTVSAYLTSDGHTVETAHSGREGVEKFRAGKFDLVMTDRMMPGMNGDQLADAIKRVAPNTAVIMLTGLGDLMNTKGEKPAGVDMVVGKPVSLNMLRQVMAQVMVRG